MKGKQFALLLLAAAVLGGLWYLAGGLRGRNWSESGNGGGKVIEFPLNEVAQVVIAGKTGDLHLVKKADEWTVQERGGYPANFEEVSDFLRKLWELKRVQVVKVGASQLPRLELVEPGKGDKAGTLVQLLGADGKPITAVLLGKPYLRKSEAGAQMDFGGMGGAGGMPAGRYVKRVGGETVSLVSETFSDADPKPERWLSKDFIKIEGAKSITVAGPTPAQHWSISRDTATAPWKLAEAKPDESVDTGKTAAFDSTLASLSFTDVEAADAKLGEPASTISIDTFEGFHYELQSGPAKAENYPVLVKVSATFPKERTPGKDEKPGDKTRLDNEFTAKQKQLEEKFAKEKGLPGRPYLVSKYSVDAFLKDRSTLLAAVPPAPATAPVTPTLPVTVSPGPAAPVPVPPVPSVSVVTPPMTAPAPRVEAVSPPVQAPLPLPGLSPSPAASPEVTQPPSTTPPPTL